MGHDKYDKFQTHIQKDFGLYDLQGFSSSLFFLKLRRPKIKVN